MQVLAVIIGCILVLFLMNELLNNRKVILSNSPLENSKEGTVIKELVDEKDDEFQSPEEIGLLDLQITDHMMLKLDYETIDIFYHKDNKYAVLCQTMGDRYMEAMSILPLKTPLNSASLIITDKDVFTKGKKLFVQFKNNNKERFINWR